MLLIDTHCHLFLYGYKQYEGGAEAVVKRVNAAGVEKLIVVGTNEQDCHKNIEFAQKNDGVYTAVGIHPDELKSGESVTQKISLIKRLRIEPKVVAIGEIGLDFYRSRKNEKEQFQFLDQILPFAIENKVPVIFHFRDAKPEANALLEKYAHKLTAVLHCFTEDLNFAKQVIDWGYKISFTNIVGYPKNDDMRNVAKSIDIDNIMIETDAPFLPPTSRRGQICEPSDVISVAKTIAELKGITLDEVAEATTNNAINFFNLK